MTARSSLCVECGPNVSIDEDGCCAHCGNGATGVWLDNHPWAPLEAHKEIDQLHAKLHDRCTCEHGNASAPITQHAKDCPIRVNLRTRIAPEVALARLAQAIDSGDEVDDLRAEIAVLTRRLHTLACALHEVCDLASAGMYSGGRLRDDCVEASARNSAFRKLAYEVTQHDSHGRGAEADGPDGSDCPCRTGTDRTLCAATGCGFCRVSKHTL
jgi:hypothetical protein